MRKAKSSMDQPLNKALQKLASGKSILPLRSNQTVFQEGETADAVYFIESGKVKITVVSPAGKEAILALLGPGDFFGEACLAGRALNTETATTLEPSTVIRIEKRAMKHALQSQPDACHAFAGALLLANARLKEDLCNQFFNHSEKRLAHVLVKLAQISQGEPVPDVKLAGINHEMLAEMVGTTRSRVTYFMNKFRQEGLIDYNGERITIHTERLTDFATS